MVTADERKCDWCERLVPVAELRNVPENSAALASACCGACRLKLGWTDEKLATYWNQFRALVGPPPARCDKPVPSSSRSQLDPCELRAAIEHLRAYVLDRNSLEEELLDLFRTSLFYSPGDERAPFFSEAFLYCLLGKEEGRAVLASVNRVLRALSEEPL